MQENQAGARVGSEGAVNGQTRGRPADMQTRSNRSHAPKFLEKLHQMIQNEDNSAIEWSEGRIIMRDPKFLQEQLIPKYYRHSRFESFQRQLNNFGFQKIEGKGKLQSCVYAHEYIKDDNVDSILTIERRKPGVKRLPGNHEASQYFDAQAAALFQTWVNYMAHPQMQQMQVRFPHEAPASAPILQSSAAETSSHPNGSYGGPHDQDVSSRTRYETPAGATGPVGRAAMQQMHGPAAMVQGPAGMPHMQGFQQMRPSPGMHYSQMLPRFPQSSAAETSSHPNPNWGNGGSHEQGVSSRTRYETPAGATGPVGRAAMQQMHGPAAMVQGPAGMPHMQGFQQMRPSPGMHYSQMLPRFPQSSAAETSSHPNPNWGNGGSHEQGVSSRTRYETPAGATGPVGRATMQQMHGPAAMVQGPAGMPHMQGFQQMRPSPGMHYSQMLPRFPQSSAAETSSHPNPNWGNGGSHEQGVSKRARYETAARATGPAGPTVHSGWGPGYQYHYHQGPPPDYQLPTSDYSWLYMPAGPHDPRYSRQQQSHSLPSPPLPLPVPITAPSRHPHRFSGVPSDAAVSGTANPASGPDNYRTYQQAHSQYSRSAQEGAAEAEASTLQTTLPEQNPHGQSGAGSL
eukprot:CAMPEP_0172646332 /NCGR_PEP_ID=MMETSP1068-20121228/240184_1 /TAXON_ID=35684 /ORGANISM="Pseudopedinella elastica, Strain CCMP716" /LENGTH=625 /DNA_ID=CAMNT_0013460589 /DNA_START=230 /DNA_END=2107 /DNA_ORIENTATION=-